MSYAQPSPPTIQTLFFTSMSATVSRFLGIGIRAELAQLLLQGHQRGALVLVDTSLVLLVGFQDAGHQLARQLAAELLEQHLGVLGLLVDGEAVAETELGVVLEQRVVPRGTAAASLVCVNGVVGRLPP